jgi:hypothetical protein
LGRWSLDWLLLAGGGGRGRAVTVYCWGRFEFGTQATAFLACRHGFRAPVAAGWVHMLCLWMVAPTVGNE